MTQPGDNQSDKKYNWMKCNVLEEIKIQVNNFTDTLSEDIPSLLSKVKDSSLKDQIENMTVKLVNSGNEINTIANDQITRDPEFWLTFQLKRGFYKELEDKINSLSNTPHIINTIGNLTASRTNLNEVKEGLQAQKNITESNKEELANKLKGIESPFGTIPMGVNETVGVFPIALASGFAIFCYFLGSCIRLRKALYESYKNPNSDTNTDPEKKISLALPYGLIQYILIPTILSG